MRASVKTCLAAVILTAALSAVATPLAAQESVASQPKDQEATRWIPVPAELAASQIHVHGLPWFDDRVGDFGRFPLSAKAIVPPAVWNRSREPSGGRIRFRSDTTRLSLRLQGESKLAQRSTMSDQGSRGLDVYVDGAYWKSVIVGDLAEHERVVMTGVERHDRQFTIYLPVGQALKVTRYHESTCSDFGRNRK